MKTFCVQIIIIPEMDLRYAENYLFWPLRKFLFHNILGFSLPLKDSNGKGEGHHIQFIFTSMIL